MHSGSLRIHPVPAVRIRGGLTPHSLLIALPSDDMRPTLEGCKAVLRTTFVPSEENCHPSKVTATTDSWNTFSQCNRDMQNPTLEGVRMYSIACNMTKNLLKFDTIDVPGII